jgi:hypothetical protein
LNFDENEKICKAEIDPCLNSERLPAKETKFIAFLESLHECCAPSFARMRIASKVQVRAQQ